jgi:hypothetical protein
MKRFKIETGTTNEYDFDSTAATQAFGNVDRLADKFTSIQNTELTDGFFSLRLAMKPNTQKNIIRFQVDKSVSREQAAEFLRLHGIPL